MAHSKRQTGRRYVFSKTIRPEFGLDVAKKTRHILFLGNPLPLGRLLVLLKVTRMLLGIYVGSIELVCSPQRLDLQHRC